jgi:hypothetical protein
MFHETVLPQEDTCAANTGNCSANDKSVHGRCCSAKRRSGFEKNNAHNEHYLEIEDSIQGRAFRIKLASSC